MDVKVYFAFVPHPLYKVEIVTWVLLTTALHDGSFKANPLGHLRPNIFLFNVNVIFEFEHEIFAISDPKEKRNNKF